MKKKVFILSIICILIFCSACSRQEIKREKLISTDLSFVSIDGISIGMPIKTVELSKYTTISADKLVNNKNTDYFKGFHITTDDDGIIVLVKAIVGTDIQVFVNGVQPLLIDEVETLLGIHHNEYWFDREQRIKAYTYYDELNKIYATFAFSDFDNSLVWVILSK